MGTWSVEPFGNDDAADFAFDLEEMEDLTVLEQAIEIVNETGDEYLEAPDAAVALAAIDVLARLKGNWGERTPYTEPADAWVKKMKLRPSPELIVEATKAIDRILGEQSELRELWAESPDMEAWKQSMEELRERVAG